MFTSLAMLTTILRHNLSFYASTSEIVQSPYIFNIYLYLSLYIIDLLKYKKVYSLIHE